MINYSSAFPGLTACFLGLSLGLLPGQAAAQSVAECLVHADEIADVGAATRGVLARVLVDRADRVTRGQIIAELEAAEEDSQVELARLRVSSDIAVRLARAKAETAELNVERLTKLVKRDLVRKTEHEAAILAAKSARLEEEEAVYQLKVAEVQLRAALATRERRRVRAPFDGVVTDTLMSVGELYNEQAAIIVIARTDPLNVEAYLPAARRAEIEVGHVANVTLETGGRLTATIHVIDPVLDAATGTFGVQLNLPNPNGNILAGQSCKLHIAPTN